MKGWGCVVSVCEGDGVCVSVCEGGGVYGECM